MKRAKMAAWILAACVLAGTLSACGQAGGNTDAENAAASAAAATVEPATVTQPVETPDVEATDETLTGSWVDVADETRFVNITKTDSGYQYEDNEGKLAATFADGKLTIKASDTETASAYVEEKTGHLKVTYQDNISEYQKKP